MLKLMPMLMLQGKIIGSRYMPAKKNQIHRKPRNQRCDHEVPQFAKRLNTNHRPEHVDRNPTGKAAQQRNNRVAQEKKRRGERHQQKMLHHMRAQYRIGESIERRSDRKPDGSEPEQKKAQPPRWKLIR